MRVLSKIEIKNNYVVKGINLEGIRKIGNPENIAIDYYNQGIDEIIFSDVVASLYQRNNLYNLIDQFSKNIFVPMTLGGGLKNINDINQALKSGADKVFFNSSVLKNPELIKEFSDFFGSQCIVISIEAKKLNNKYICFYNSGRENSNKEVSNWIQECESLGCGEFLITSIDKDGTRNGFDLELLDLSLKFASRPVIISGGGATQEHVEELIKNYKPSGICFSSCLHYELMKIGNIKKILKSKNINYVR